MLADKGYDADAIRADLSERNIEAVIPGRSNRRVKIEHDRALYKQRNPIERMFGHLKINRAIATRYDQLANSFLSMVHLASARYWLKFVHAACRKPGSPNGITARCNMLANHAVRQRENRLSIINTMNQNDHSGQHLPILANEALHGKIPAKQRQSPKELRRTLQCWIIVQS